MFVRFLLDVVVDFHCFFHRFYNRSLCRCLLAVETLTCYQSVPKQVSGTTCGSVLGCFCTLFIICGIRVGTSIAPAIPCGKLYRGHLGCTPDGTSGLDPCGKSCRGHPSCTPYGMSGPTQVLNLAGAIRVAPPRTARPARPMW